MNKIDLIIEALEHSMNEIFCDSQFDKLAEALTAARELRNMKPVAYQLRMKANWESNWQEWNDCNEGVANDYIKTPRLNDWSFEVRKLYTLGDADE